MFAIVSFYLRNVYDLKKCLLCLLDIVLYLSHH